MLDPPLCTIFSESISLKHKRSRATYYELHTTAVVKRSRSHSWPFL